jgi:hypothetical protein
MSYRLHIPSGQPFPTPPAFDAKPTATEVSQVERTQVGSHLGTVLFVVLWLALPVLMMPSGCAFSLGGPWGGERTLAFIGTIFAYGWIPYVVIRHGRR